MNRLLTLLSIQLLSASAFSASTLQLSNPINGSIASGFADQFGVATNGMRWGIIVDTGGNGFSGSGMSFDPMIVGPSVAGFMSFSNGITDDYFIPSSSLTTDSSLALESDFTTPGGNGTITNVVVDYVNGVAAGQSFGIIWFATNSSGENDYYGFVTLGQVLPADNLAAVDLSAPFAGVDPIRAATFQFQAIPEPSRFLLIGLAGLVGIMRRRR